GTVNANGGVNVGNLFESSGTLGGTGDVVITSNMFWTGGAINGLGPNNFPPRTSLNIRCRAAKGVSQPVVSIHSPAFFGSVALDDAIWFLNNARLKNNSNFTVQGGGCTISSPDGSGAIINNGTITAVAGSAVTIAAPLINNNTLNVGGQLNVNGTF